MAFEVPVPRSRLIVPAMTVAALVLIGSGGCIDPFKTGSSLSAWIVEDSREVGPTSGRVARNEIYSAADQTLRLTAAVNETVAFQLVLSTARPPGWSYRSVR